MATELKLPVQVSPPEKFNFSTPVAWPQWRKRFERFMSVSGQNCKSDEEKINILVYIMGEESEEILLQFSTAPTTYIQALEMFEIHFIPRRNIIFERYKFNSREQRPGEPVESFITNLHSLAEHCNYGALKEELIRDRIVVGMTDKKTSERLQLQANLTLSDCVLAAKQAELQASQSREIRANSSSDNQILALGAVKQDGSIVAGSSRNSQNRGKIDENKKCGFCGFPFHTRDKCPANNSTCNKCKKLGHWAKVCRSNLNTKVRSVEFNCSCSIEGSKHEMEKDSAFLGSIQLNHLHCREWTIPIHVSKLKKNLNFLIDTGADITCIPMNVLDRKIIKSLSFSNKHVTGPSGIKLNIVGTFTAVLSYLDRQFQTEVYVIKELNKPILGRPTIIHLKILQWGEGVQSIKLNDVQNNSNYLINDIENKFPKIFDEIGTFKTEMEIKVKEGVQPYIQSVPRVVPIPLLDPLKDEIARLKKLDIIEPVDYYTPWVSPIVVVRKGAKIRLCVDYTHLNKAVLRSYFPIGKVETILTRIKGSKYFSKLDTTSGFYQIRLNKESRHLTCFITPFGRFLFKRLPFGITCAPEYFSILLNNILAGMDGVISHIDDILIHAPNLERHNEILNEVLSRIQAEGITLNREKCVFGVQSLTFLGHNISNNGISVDPERISSIKIFPEPDNKKELLQFLGMINFSSRFIPNRSEVLEPLTSLLKKNVPFVWDIPQKEAFKKIKSLLQESPCLAYFDTSKQISISADASSYGLGACLIIQSEDGKKEIVSYASRLLSATEKRYAQIEREALALTWACDKFHEYITGIPVLLETDHKPLIQVLQSKPIDELTPRLQRFRIRLMRYEYKVYYVPGKDLVVADALSRNFSKSSSVPTDDELADETEAHVNLIVDSFAVKSYFLDEIKQEQAKDIVCRTLKEYSFSGWPNKNQLDKEIVPYYQYRFEITENEGFLLRGTRIIIPKSLQAKCLSFIHQGHQGIVKCRLRAKSSVWWYGLSTQIENCVCACSQCVEHRINPREPFLKDAFPERPWQKIALDLFKSNSWYLIVTDYYSRFFEIFKLTSLTETEIINKMRELFARYGIPDIIRSDNGPQFKSEFKKFAYEMDFKHITSSPYFPQSNGCIEAAVKVAKGLLKKNDDIYLALLAYRSTPLECGFSPAELLMNRKIKSQLPILPSQLNNPVNTKSVFNREGRAKERSAVQFNERHRTKELSQLMTGDSVWVTDLKAYGKVVQLLKEPRSYLIETDSGTYRRNRWHLIPAPYYNWSKFTPTLPSLIPTTESEQSAQHVPSTSSNEIVPSNSNTSEVNGDYSLSASAPVSSTEHEERASSPVQSRPTRNVRKPSYLDDYIT